MSWPVERARAEDLAPARELLGAADLPDHGVADQFGHYFVVRDAGRVVGLCGLEVHGDDGLLRSAVVEDAFRGQGLGRRLVEATLSLADRLGLRAVYLLTTTAHEYFARIGFEDWPRDDAPREIRDSWEYRSGCPTTAAFMRRATSRPPE